LKTFNLGKCYFTLSYYDEQLDMPLVETYVFIGVDLLEGDKDRPERTWYFKLPDNFVSTGYRLERTEFEQCVRFGEDTIELVLDLPDLVSQLQKRIQGS
jgi:hypothetical protein